MGRDRVARTLVLGLVALFVVAPISAWAALALWFRLPAPEAARVLAAGLFVLLGLVTAAALFSRRRRPAIIAFALAFGGLLIWWGSIKPPANGDWAPDVARQTTGALDGDILTLTDVRDFDWKSDKDFVERWNTRTYDLAKLRTLDLFLSYWSGPQMAHLIMSFGFEGDDQLAWSIEVKHSKDGEYSPVADAFKTNPVVFIAADERDVVRPRSNVRDEDVRLYRLRTSPEGARALLLQYVADANAVAAKPAFYNSITTNCTTQVARMVRAAGGILPFDWRLIVNGYLPSYLYDRGALDAALPLAELEALARIDERAKQADRSPDFSRLIRIGVPSPSGQGEGG
jgi:hypothetical protein